MNKFVKNIVLMSVIILSIVAIIFNSKFSIKDEVYVVSEIEEKERINEEKIKNESLDIDKSKEDIGELKEGFENNSMVTIFVSGEVEKPGVVTLSKEKRLSDAVEELGGFTKEADLNKINLAIKIEDEKHYIIPKLGEGIEDIIQMDDNVNEKNINNENTLININTADINKLDTLPGVGESTANKIVNYREESGKFKTIEEIKNVNGIGDKKYEEIKELISVE